MTVDQLFLRLPDNALRFLECLYLGDYWHTRTEKISNEIGVGYTEIFWIKENTNDLDEKPIKFSICVDAYTGIILNEGNIADIIVEKTITLEELLPELEQIYQDKYDFSSIKKSISDHKISLELRRIVLQLVALRLLYSKTDNPQIGYIRAKRFIKEFNRKIPELNLSSKKIDEIMGYNLDEGYNKYSNDCEIKEPLVGVVKNVDDATDILIKGQNSSKLIKRNILKRIFSTSQKKFHS